MAITFTIEDVRAAYRATGLKPRNRLWLRANYATDTLQPDYRFACPIGALLTKRCGPVAVAQHVEDTNIDRFATSELDLSCGELSGFVAGVDGRSYVSGYMDLAAYDFGRKVWSELADPEPETDA